MGKYYRDIPRTVAADGTVLVWGVPQVTRSARLDRIEAENNRIAELYLAHDLAAGGGVIRLETPKYIPTC